MAEIALQPGDLLRVRPCCYMEDQLAMNVLYYRIDSITGGITYLEDVPNAFYDFMANKLATLVNNNAAVVGVMVARLLPSDTRTNDFLSDEELTQGTAGEATLPGQTAGIWSFYRNRAGRMARGRNYLPFPSEEDNNNDTHLPTASYVTRLQEYIAFMSPNVVVPVKTHSITCAHMIWGKLTHEDPVIRSRARQKWATQRRRGSYGAKNVNPFQ